MVKLKDYKYRDSVITIMKRDWLDKDHKYYALEAIINVMVRDSESKISDLKIAQRVRAKYL